MVILITKGIISHHLNSMNKFNEVELNKLWLMDLIFKLN